MDDFHIDFDMPGLPPALLQRLDKTLQDCGEFQSHAALRGVFIDARLKLWRAELPEAANLKERVAAVKDYLYERFNQGVNGLCLLLCVLRDSRSPEDDLHRRLSVLAAELEALQLGAQAKAAARLAEKHPAQLPVAHAAAQRWAAAAPDDPAASRLLTQVIAQEDAIRQAQEEAERQAREEAERKAQEEADRKAKEEADRQAQEEADRKAKEEADRKAKAEAARKAQEEADRKAKEEADRKAKAEAARKAKEEAARKAKEEADRKAHLTELCTQMQAAADRQDWPDVLRLAQDVQVLQPGDANAAQWVAYAQEQLRRIAVPPPPVITPPPVVTQPSSVAGRPAAIARRPFEPELILIPAGEFLMGSNPQKDRNAQECEQPQHKLYLPDYFIAKTPITNAQYAVFVQATGYESPENWENNNPLRNEQDHPVAWVSRHDAMAYCQWLAKVTGKPYMLPSEAEWEKAARGTVGWLYPWGDTPPNEQLCNFNNRKGTTPVGKYSPQGDSPYGCVDMAGNMWEWTRSLWGSDYEKPDFTYPYKVDDGRENLTRSDECYVVARGGAFWNDAQGIRCAVRNPSDLLNDEIYDYAGFRVSVVSPFFSL